MGFLACCIKLLRSCGVWSVVFLVVCGCTIFFVVGWKRSVLRMSSIRRVQNDKPHRVVTNEQHQPSSREQIVPRISFDWKVIKPLQLRPFKPKYHLTMSVESSFVSELVEMDYNYLDRIHIRRSIMASNPEITLAADGIITEAVNEFYIWIFGEYLPTRYPTMFELQPERGILLNKVTEEAIQLQPNMSTLKALKVIGSHIDDDFLFLLPSPDGYILHGFVVCFPSGFNTSHKLGMTLKEIHGPVPSYKQKLEMSMDRFFERLEVGRFVKRANWTITTTDELFKPGGTHLYEGEVAPEEDIDISKTNLRVERQMLHRLPISRAVVFSFETYLYSISQIKKEGLGEDLATAIEGLKEGSAPGFHFYKRAGFWGEAVKAFLRGTNVGDTEYD